MTHRPSRVRRVLLAITLVMLGVLLAARGLSFWNPIGLSHTDGTLLSPGQVQDQPDAWERAGWTIALFNDYGSAGVSYTTFDAIGWRQEDVANLACSPGSYAYPVLGHADWPDWL